MDLPIHPCHIIKRVAVQGLIESLKKQREKRQTIKDHHTRKSNLIVYVFNLSPIFVLVEFYTASAEDVSISFRPNSSFCSHDLLFSSTGGRTNWRTSSEREQWNIVWCNRKLNEKIEGIHLQQPKDKCGSKRWLIVPKPAPLPSLKDGSANFNPLGPHNKVSEGAFNPNQYYWRCFESKILVSISSCSRTPVCICSIECAYAYLYKVNTHTLTLTKKSK